MNETVVPQRRCLSEFPIAISNLVIIEVGKRVIDVDSAVVPRVSQGTELVQKRIPILQSGVRTADLLCGRLERMLPDTNPMTAELEQWSKRVGSET